MGTALKLSALETGAPEVLAGHQSLDRAVRWVHIAESSDVTNVLHGGELLLSEGYMFNGKPSDERQLIATLAERNISALVIELGAVYRSIPRHLIEMAEARGLPLIALHLPVPFIDITESVHRQIVTDQLTLFDRAQEVQDAMTSIVLGGGDVRDVLEALAASLGNPIIYELDGGGFGGRALRYNTDREVSAAWESFVLGLDGSPETHEAELVAKGGRLGRLVLLGMNAPLAPSDRTTLDRCAATVVLAVMAEGGGDRPERRRSGGLLAELLRGDLEPFIAERRAAEMGFKPGLLLPMTLRAARHNRPRTAATEERSWSRVLEDVSTHLRSRLKAVLIEEGGPADSTMILGGLTDASHWDRTADLVAKCVSAATQRHLGVPDAGILCVGAPVHTWQAVLDGFDLCNDTMAAALHCPPRAWHDATDVDLDRLLWSLRESPDMERFARVRLSRLVQHDRTRHTDLVYTLRVLLEHNGHKANTARTLHLERQALYNRMARIESLTRLNLANPDTRLGLHLAIRMMSHLDPDSWVD